jgi:hypothetical protein
MLWNCCRRRGERITIFMDSPEVVSVSMCEFDTVRDLLVLCGKQLDVDPSEIQLFFTDEQVTTMSESLYDIGMRDEARFVIDYLPPPTTPPPIPVREAPPAPVREDRESYLGVPAARIEVRKADRKWMRIGLTFSGLRTFIADRMKGKAD